MSDERRLPDDDVPLWKRVLTGQLPLEQETGLFVVVSVLDIVMTYNLMANHGFGESNPLARYFIHHWGAKGMIYFKMAMTAFVCLLSQVIARVNVDRGRFVLRIGTLIVAGVVIYSLVLVLRSKGMV
jgi:hypothetical protein